MTPPGDKTRAMTPESRSRSITAWFLLRQLAVCAAVGAAGVGFVWGLAKTAEWNEPVLDLGRRVTATDPAPLEEPASGRLRFAVATMVCAEATFSGYHRLVERICEDVGLREAFVLRPSYAEVRRGLEQGNIDVAFVCTGTYASAHMRALGAIRLLVQPEFVAGFDYRCLLLVPSRSPFKAFEDIQGATVAFSDPESNTGCIVPSAFLAEKGHHMKSFFGKVVFTGSHDRSIRAVAMSVVDAAAVDSLVWQSMLRKDPALAGRCRIVWRSNAFGPPPVVVRRGLDPDLERRLRQAFQGLDKDEPGRALLSGLGIKRFVPARPQDYQTAIALYRHLQEQGGVPWR